jgi:hypothetical protein
MNSTALSIRTARHEDYASLWTLASLDSRLLPEEPLLVAEADGAIVAALSLETGESIADPFRRTSDIVAMLQLRARQMPESYSSHRILRRLRHRPAAVAA